MIRAKGGPPAGRLATLVTAALLGCARGAAAPAPTNAPAPVARAAPAATPASDSVQRSRDRYVREVLSEIAGREDQPAASVFKNIKIFTQGVPARRLLSVMNVGFSRSLGVSCDHCHVLGEWDREDKPQKQIAREMLAMSRTITDSLLGKIRNLRGPNPVVNCTTCHRGQVKPALDLP